MSRTFVSPDRLNMPTMVQAARAGDLVVISGQAAWDVVASGTADANSNFPGSFVGEGDADAQAKQIFKNIEDSLAECGASLRDVVMLNCFLADRAHYPAYRDAKIAAFEGLGYPGGTTVVAELLDPRFFLEVEAWAVLDS